MGHMRNSYISVENPTGNRPVAGWGWNDIETEFRDTGCADVKRVHVA
jgi:hypothetical protein